MPVKSPVLITQAATLTYSRNAPVLCVDTCALLDVLRAPFTPYGAQTIAAAQALAKAEHDGKLTIVMAPSIPEEIQRNLPNERGKLANDLARHDDELKSIDDCMKQCGLSVTVPSFARSGLHEALETLLDALVHSSQLLEEDVDARARATDRAVKRLRPARKGSILDADIIEHYFALGGELRRLRFGGPLVFVSSNTRDYTDGKALRTVHPDLSPQFLSLALEYATALPQARRNLGL
jgi:hypothetical protein